MTTAFNYAKLTGKIVERFRTQGVFAERLGLSSRSLSLKLNNQRGWKQTEIEKACTLLDIPISEVSEYFFAQ